MATDSNFILAGVALLALDVAVSGLGQQRRGTGEQTIAGVDFVGGVAGDHEERDTVANLRRPLRLLVEAGLDGGLRRIVPDEAVALVGDEERDAGGGRGGREVVVPAADGMAAMIEEAFVIVAEAVVVLVVGRDESGADGEELGISRAAIVVDVGSAVLVIGDGLLPSGHLEKFLAFRRGEGDVRAGRRAVEELRDVEFGAERRMRRRMIALDGGDDARGLVDVVEVALALGPAFRIGSADETVAGLGESVLVLQAESHPKNVGGIRLEDDGLAVAIDFEALIGGLAGTDCRR